MMTNKRNTAVRSNSKMQDLTEFRRWHAEGRPYKWMVEEYKRKYDIDASVAMFTNWASRLGLRKRVLSTKDDTLAPWDVKHEHQYRLENLMLYQEMRRRQGLALSPDDAAKLHKWKEILRERDWVVHYEPDTEEGFYYTTRRPDIDLDLVREP